MPDTETRRKKEKLTLIVVFLAVLLVSAFGMYFLTARTTRQEPSRGSLPQTNTQTTPDARPSPTPGRGDNIMEEVFGVQPKAEPAEPESWTQIVAGLTVKLSLAALLGAVLAYRPRRRAQALKRNPYVAQTQILLAVVASALMIVVGDNAARAFGIFAAVSLVRFRTNIRDPKEITVLLISLAIGLGTGVGRWDLAVVLTIFSLLALWALEYREPELVFRALNLRVLTRNIESTQRALKEVLKRHNFESELRTISGPPEPGKPGSLVYSIDVSPKVSTDELSEEILSMEAANIDSIEWEQKKSFSYVYQ